MVHLCLSLDKLKFESHTDHFRFFADRSGFCPHEEGGGVCAVHVTPSPLKDQSSWAKEEALFGSVPTYFCLVSLVQSRCKLPIYILLSLYLTVLFTSDIYQSVTLSAPLYFFLLQLLCTLPFLVFDCFIMSFVFLSFIFTVSSDFVIALWVLISDIPDGDQGSMNTSGDRNSRHQSPHQRVGQWNKFIRGAVCRATAWRRPSMPSHQLLTGGGICSHN